MSTKHNSARDEAEERIQALMAKGMTRDRAAARVFKQQPELQARMIAEANPERDPPRRAA